MSSQPPWQRPPSGQPPQAPQQPPPAHPMQPVLPPGSGAPPAASPPPPTGFAPPPAQPPGGSNTKLIVTIVAAVVVLGIVGSVVVLAGGKDEPGTGAEAGPVPGVGSGAGSEPGPDRGSNRPPPDAEVRSLIQDQVGPYILTSAEQDPEAIGNGAFDAYVAEYEAGDGSALIHGIYGFSSPEEAAADLESLITRLQELGYTVTVEPQPLTDENGRQIGVLVILVNEQEGVEIWGWTNGNLSLDALGATGQVEQFYAEVPY